MRGMYDLDGINNGRIFYTMGAGGRVFPLTDDFQVFGIIAEFVDPLFFTSTVFVNTFPQSGLFLLITSELDPLMPNLE